MASGSITSWQVEREKAETGTDFLFLDSKITLVKDCAMKLKMLSPWKESYDKPRQHIKKQRHHFAHKGPYCQSYSFSSSQIHMWELDHKEGWELKNWCFWIVVLRRLLRVPWSARRPDTDVRKDLRQKGKGWQRMRWLDSLTGSIGMNLSKLQEIVNDKRAWRVSVPEATKSGTRLNNWTTATWPCVFMPALHICCIFLPPQLASLQSQSLCLST